MGCQPKIVYGARKTFMELKTFQVDFSSGKEPEEGERK
jgi:hypothetical protein